MGNSLNFLFLKMNRIQSFDNRQVMKAEQETQQHQIQAYKWGSQEKWEQLVEISNNCWNYQFIEKKPQDLERIQFNGFHYRDDNLGKTIGMSLICKFQWINLKQIFLVYHKIGNQGMKHLAHTYCPQLERLDLDNNEIGDLGMKYLGLTNWPKLKYLCLRNNTKIGDQGFKHITSGNWHGLRNLIVEYNYNASECGYYHLMPLNCGPILSMNVQQNKVVNRKYKIKEHFLARFRTSIFFKPFY